jgi:hypothetical protein
VVISDKFVWLHFPKCSGSETERLLRAIFGTSPGTTFDPLNANNVIWHHSIADRRAFDKAFDPGSRDVLCNIRRLPTWILSRVHYEYSRSPGLKVTRSMLVAGEFFEADGFKSKADWYAKSYTAVPVTRWIRTENLAKDFIDTFSTYTDLSAMNVADMIRRTNVTAIPYIPEVAFHFSRQDLEGLYASNPIWTNIERSVYGNLLEVS